MDAPFCRHRGSRTQTRADEQEGSEPQTQNGTRLPIQVSHLSPGLHRRDQAPGRRWRIEYRTGTEMNQMPCPRRLKGGWRGGERPAKSCLHVGRWLVIILLCTFVTRIPNTAGCCPGVNTGSL